MSKSSKPKPEDIAQIQNDVASFASSLGLSSSLPSSGFNDVDFRPKQQKNNTKKSKTTPNQHQIPQTQKPTSEITQSPKPRKEFPKDEKPTKREPVFSKIDEVVTHQSVNINKYKNMPKLPLVKANVLGTWYVDGGELEGRVMGGGGGERKESGIGSGAEEWKEFVGKKKELGERLLAQYTLDYESGRGQSSDIRMLLNTQRGGTAADKVSAYSVLVGDNPVANMRSLDALLGEFLEWRN